MKNGANNKNISDLSDQLFSEILIEQQKYMKIKGPDEDKKHLPEASLEKYKDIRGRGFIFQYLSSGRGHGPFTEQIDGSIKYDLIGAIGPNVLGHSHPLYIKANLEAATSDVITCGNLLSYNEAYQLTQTLISSVEKSNLKHFWFAGSGSFANDTALKILWQKKARAYKLIAFEKAFAGRSIAMQDITYNPAYREDMPSTIQVDHVPHYNINDPDNSLQITLDALDELVRDNKKAYCAIMMELVQGEAGFVYGPKSYYQEICKWAKKKNIYIWFDEVQTFSRTRELFAYQMLELDEYVDVVTVGKALQACGTFFTEELNPKPGLVAGTFNGGIAALNAGNKIVKYLLEGNFYGDSGKIQALETKFLSRLNALSSTRLKGKLGYSGGIGTMISFEVGDSSKETSMKFIHKLYENGIIAFVAGKDPVRIRLLIPVVLSDDHIDEIFIILEKTINEVI